MKHNELVDKCLFFLGLNKIFAWQNNTGAAKIGNAFVQFGKKGSSDIIGILPDGRFLGVEIKIGKDTQKSEQIIFQDRIERNGGIYILVRDDINILIRHHAIIPFITCDVNDALRRMRLPPVAE